MTEQLPNPKLDLTVGLRPPAAQFQRSADSITFTMRDVTMKALFSTYYRASAEDLQAIWSEGMFVVDTNVLLSLYRYPKQAQHDLLQALRGLSTRLWVPHQAALEFQENRLDVISDQLSRYAEVKQLLVETLDGLRKGLDRMQLKERHSRIDPDPFLTTISQAFTAFDLELDALQKQHDVRDTDPTRDAIDELLTNRVGSSLTQGELDDLYKDGAKRYEQRRPPGYLDSGKEREKRPCYFFDNLALKRQYGDLIIWYQIIKEAKSRAAKAVVVVTEDRKEDWWWIHKGQTIGPRPELAAEISAKSGVSLFHMYRVDRFLHFAREYLGADVKDDSVAQVRDIATTDAAIRGRMVHEEMAYTAVSDWLATVHPQGRISHTGIFPDLVVADGAKRIGYEIKVAHQLSQVMVRQWSKRGETEIKLPHMSQLSAVVYVIVCSDQREAMLASRVVDAHRTASAAVGFVVGYLFGVDDAPVRFLPIGSSANSEELSRDPSLLCPNCRNWGPWDGTRCLSCGRMSDPNN